MGASRKLRLLFSDRVGIVADVAAVLAEEGLNIVSMEVEVEAQGAHAAVYVEAAAGDEPSGEEGDLLGRLRALPDLLEISAISVLPQERREGRLRVVLDSISDGILAVDEGGEVAVINQVAKRILNCRARDVIGKDLRDLGLPDTSVLECLTGKGFVNAKRNVITEGGRFQFLATGTPILGSSGQVVGAVETMKDMREVRQLASAVAEPPQTTFSDMIGQSPAVQQAISFAQKIAATDAVVALRGESGTGKELFASAIHAESGRPGAFLPVNCAALPEALLESELFGYVAGAFSGARREGKPGLFELAKDGTLFLDEIGEMPLPLQAKMLRVIQDRRVRRVGGAQEVPVNTRIVTATNKNLERLMEEGGFREDLYYRINVFPIHIPPLRERLEDIPLLAENFLFQFNSRLGKPAQSLSRGARDKLCRHRWPGNVRELRNVIERAAILCTSETIGEEGILTSSEVGRAFRDGEGSAPRAAGAESLAAQLNRREREIIGDALERSASKRKAAKLLGISHTALLNKLKKYGLGSGRD